MEVVVKRRWICATLVLLATASPFPTAAEWMPAGNPICAAPGWQGIRVTLALPNHYDFSPPTSSMFVLWSDNRDALSGGGDLFFNWINPHGDVFAPNGSEVVDAPGFQGYTDATTKGVFGSDFIGNFGFGIAWADNRNGPLDIFAQSLPEILGYTPAWPLSGVPVCTAPGIQSNARVVGDVDGGVTIAWIDQRDGDYAIYAQRLDTSGAAQWTTNGVLLCGGPGYRSDLQLVGTGDGGAFLAWNDTRLGPYQVFLHRITPSGAPAAGWPEGGRPVTPSLTHRNLAHLISDGTGGVYVVWHEDVPRALRIDATGAAAPAWPAAGVPLAQTPADRVVSDALLYQGGLVALWEQDNTPDDTVIPDLYAQRLDASGSRPAGWGADGVAVCTEEGSQRIGRLATQIDAIVATWTDDRAGHEDVYAMRLQDDGTPHPEWTPGGVAIAAAPGRQVDSEAVGDGQGLVMICWVDEPNFNSFEPDLLVRAVDLSGNIVVGTVGVPGPGPAPARFDLAPARPNPAHTHVSLDLDLDHDGETSLDILDASGRRVQAFRLAGGPGRQTVRWDLNDASGRRVPAGVYFARVRSASGERARPVVVRN